MLPVCQRAGIRLLEMPIFYALRVPMQSERRHQDATRVTHKFIHKNCELFLRLRQNRLRCPALVRFSAAA
jgi:hypothetical protein